MSNLITRYEVEVFAHYTSDDLESRTREEAQDEAINAFYDNSHRATIDDTRVTDEWLDCLRCGDTRVDDDHKCEGSDDEPLSDDY